MRQHAWAWVILAALFIQVPAARGQSTSDVLKEELEQIKQQHEDASTQDYTNFLSQLDAAMGSSDAALTLYQNAGGAMPAPTPVKTRYSHETPDEKAVREAQDSANLTSVAAAAQLHCGLMHFAALFITAPKQKGLHDEWIAWLKNASQIYLQIKDLPPDPAGKTDPALSDLKKATMHDSLISNYLGFHGWDSKDKPQDLAANPSGDPATWSVQKLTELYRTEVLDPLRVTPSADTLAAWDTYILLRQADQPDTNAWAQVDSLSLEFDRTCDDYAVQPASEKLQALNDILAKNPHHPNFDDMYARDQALIEDYGKHHPSGGVTQAPAPAPAPSGDASTTNSNVTVTTQGDMTIVTTHPSTNSAPTSPPAPAPQ